MPTTFAGSLPLPGPADVLLADGSIAVIRALRRDDREAVDLLHEEASDKSLRWRFFAVSRQAAHDYVTHIFSDDEPAASLVATVRGVVVAVATAEWTGAPDTAEVAFLVADTEHGRGVGGLLLEHLAALARGRGIRSFTAEVLCDNVAMSRVFLDAGFRTTHVTRSGVMEVEMETAASTRALAAADLRESRSEARSLSPLLGPTCVAVVGARRDASGIGHAVLDSIREGGFTGDLVAVHPHAEVIDGVRAFPRLVDVPQHIDIAIVAVPATATLGVAEDAAAAGVSILVVISSGFEELGGEGVDIQRRLVRLARDHTMRVVGPNCLGVMVNDPEIRLNATFTRMVPPPGGLAIASQSGGVGIALLDVATRHGLGVGSFVSLGNKADVSGNDLLAAWLADPRVTAAALYLESFGNAGKFARVARRFSEKKPLLAVMGGRSSGGRRAGASHTAAAATPAVGIDVLFTQAGVIACDSAEAMAETALVLAEQPRPSGDRVAVISNAGGLGVLAADAADAIGLVVPELTASLRHRLQRHVPGTGGTSNPIDLGAAASPEVLAGVAADVLASPEVDAVVVVLVATSVADPAPLVGALAEVCASHPDTPVLLVPMGGLDPGTVPGVTVLPSVDAAVGALARVVRYTEWLAVPREEPAPYDEQRAADARRVADRLLETAPDDDGWLAPDEVAELLAPYALASTGRVVHTATEAVEAAHAVGFPVALKVADPRVVHKTDRGLVRTGLTSTDELLDALQAFEAELTGTDVPVLVQPMVTGLEVALGIVRDPGFGPLVMVAAGGVSTGVWADRVFLMPPVTAGDAARAVRALRLWPLLEGHRGSAPLDSSGLEQLVVGVARLAEDVPQVAELDLNPVMVLPSGTALVDVKVRLTASAGRNAGVPRQLRPPT